MHRPSKLRTVYGFRHKFLEENITEKNRRAIQERREAGQSYTQISKALNVSRNTVKSVCQRMGIQPADAARETHDANHCRQCGVSLVQNVTGKRKRFCSDKCRRTWWKEHRDKLRLQSAAKAKCAFCGCAFEDYAKNNRKYCSHGCYIRDRFGEKKPHDKRAV